MVVSSVGHELWQVTHRMGSEVVLTVPSEKAGMRLDTFLALQFPDFSRSRCQQLLREGRVKVDGVVVLKPSYVLRGGEQIVLTLPEPLPPTLQPEPIPLSVLYEDDDLLVVNKPRGMVVHPGAGVQKGTLVNALLAMNIPLSDVAGPERRGIIHRLDKGTSGVMVIAKTNFAHLHLAKQFAEHTVDKRYLAIVAGEPAFEHQMVAAPLQRHPEDPERFVVAMRPSAHTVEAVTELWVRERFDGFALLEIKPITGRTHQIRVHLQFLRLPVVGDETYGGREKALKVARERKWHDVAQAITNLNGQALHAWRLTFVHPRSGETVTVEAPLPEDMATLLRILRQKGATKT